MWDATPTRPVVVTVPDMVRVSGSSMMTPDPVAAVVTAGFSCAPLKVTVLKSVLLLELLLPPQALNTTAASAANRSLAGPGLCIAVIAFSRYGRADACPVAGEQREPRG